MYRQFGDVITAAAKIFGYCIAVCAVLEALHVLQKMVCILCPHQTCIAEHSVLNC